MAIPTRLKRILASNGQFEIAQSQRAKGWELRATVSFARLLRDTNHRDEARAMLAEIYSWFSEGFEP